MLERSEASKKEEQRFFTAFRMTKQSFVIDEFCEKQNESMTFFVIDEFCSNRSNVA